MEKIFLINQLKNNNTIYENIINITPRQGDDCKAGCLLDYAYFRVI